MDAELRLGRVAHEAMAVLYQHRLATTDQLRRLLTPHTSYRQYVGRTLKKLFDHGLADRVKPPHKRAHRWFLTEAGAEAVETAGEVTARPYRIDAARAAGPLQHHMVAVVETGIAFTESARRTGDECGPLDWMPEVAHRTRDGGRRFEDDHLIADALLHYIRIDPDTDKRIQTQFLIELDRSTMPVPRLALKLNSYARYYDYVPGGAANPVRASAAASSRPAWQNRYPRFPRVLVVLDGAPPRLLENRRIDLAVYTQQLRYLQQPRDDFAIGVTTMPELQEHGPTADIWLPLLAPDREMTDFRLHLTRKG